MRELVSYHSIVVVAAPHHQTLQRVHHHLELGLGPGAWGFALPASVWGLHAALVHCHLLLLHRAAHTRAPPLHKRHPQFGQLGLGDTADRHFPTRVPGTLAGRRIATVAAGAIGIRWWYARRREKRTGKGGGDPRRRA